MRSRQETHFRSASFFHMICYLFWISTFFLETHSQTCSIARELAPAECQSLIYSSFFLPPNVTIDGIVDGSLSAIFSVSPFENSCRIPAIKYLCSSYYQPCTFQQPPQSSLPNFLVFPLPRSPCRSLCQEMRKACNHILPTHQLPDCNQEEFETIPCNNYAENHTIGRTKICPKPLELRDEGKANPPCQLPCPLPFWTEEQRTIAHILLDVWGPISFVSSLWVIICWVAHKQLRQFPSHLPLFPTVASLVQSITIIVSAIVGYQNVLCIDNWTPGNTTSLCGVQAFFIMWTSMVISFYTFFISLNLFLVIFLELKMEEFGWYPWLVHSIGMIVPLTFAVVLYAAEKYQNIGFGVCWITGGSKEYHWAFAFCYGWHSLFICCNFIMSTAVCVKLYKLFKMYEGKSRLSWRNIGMLVFVGCFFVVYVWQVCYYLNATINEIYFSEPLEDYFECHVQLRDDCQLDSRNEFWYAISTLSIWTLAGFWMLVSFTNTKLIHKNGLLFSKELFLKGNWHTLITGLNTETTTTPRPT